MGMRGQQWGMLCGIWSMLFSFKRLLYNLSRMRIARIVFQKSWDGLVVVSTLLDDATTSEVFSQLMDPKGR
ncbi:hypothetical protein CsSME_00000705 [Camellia sinensis var. sinensis]